MEAKEANIRDILARNIKKNRRKMGFRKKNWQKKPEFPRHLSP
jgi:hypothetical protein